MRRDVTILDPQMLTTFLLTFVIVTALLIGAAVIQKLRLHYFGNDEPDDVLSSLREALEDGELDKVEFERVKDSVARAEAKGPEWSNPLDPVKPVKKSDVGGWPRERD